jgi:cytochrome b
MHPLWWLVFPFVGGLAALEASTYVKTGVVGRWTERRGVERGGAVVVVALLAVWAARMFGAFGGPVGID